jgi:hypothetical protein
MVFELRRFWGLKSRRFHRTIDWGKVSTTNSFFCASQMRINCTFEIAAIGEILTFTTRYPVQLIKMLNSSSPVVANC